MSRKCREEAVVEAVVCKRKKEKGLFEDIIDLIIILIVLEFLCECVLGDDC